MPRAPVGERGVVLVAVLLLLLAAGAIAFAMSLEAGLATLGARAATGAAQARPAARAGLVLAVRELVEAGGGLGPLPAVLGPWEAVAATVRVEVEVGAGPAVYRLSARAEAGRAVAEARAVLVLEPAPEVLEWREP